MSVNVSMCSIQQNNFVYPGPHVYVGS